MKASQRAIVLLFLMQWLDLPLFSQKDSLTEPYIRANAVSVLLGFTGNEFTGHNLTDIRRIAPDNSIVQMDQSNAVHKRTAGGSGNMRLNLGLNIHFKTKDFKTAIGRFSSEWRVGVALATSVTERIIFQDETVYSAVDTFYSNHTGMVVYEGAVASRYYQYKVFSKQAYLDISKTYHTNQLKRVSFYTGINAGVGLSFQNFVKATWANDDGTRKGSPYRPLNISGNSENTDLKNEAFYTLSLPVGMVLRVVSTKKQLARKFAFTAESRFGYRFGNDIYGNNTPVFIAGLQIGVKLYFHKQATE